MKGFLPFLRRSLSPRSLLLSVFLVFISVVSVQAKTVVVGAGFGFISVPNMTGLNPGDVIAIKPGTYTGGSFFNLVGITITNNGGAVIFNNTVTFFALQSCTFDGFQFINCPGIAIRWDGNSNRCVEKNIYFNNVQGDCNNASEHNNYNGDTSTLKLYMCTFDSLTAFRSGLIMMGSWGDAYSGICFMDSIVFSRVKIDSTTTNGTEVRGTFFRLDAHDWRVIYKGVITTLGDVGIFYISGSGSFHHIYRNGGRGYIVRLWNSFLKNQGAGNSYFYDNVDLNSTVYGSIDLRTEPQYFTQYLTGGDCFIYNNTAGNKGDNIGYWSSVAVVGQYFPPYVCHIKNNLGFNITTNGHTTIMMNQGGAWTGDTSNNMYFNVPDGVVDPVTGIPVANSPVLGKGMTIPWIKDDLYHNPRSGAYDIGAVQHGGAIIPPPPNQLPVAIAGAAQTITLPVNNSTLDGTKSYDPDGSISKYAWTQVSGTGGTITNPANASTTVTGLTQGTYIYKLTVTDNSNGTATALDTIIVKAAANLPPIANAGASKSITLPLNTTSLDGSLSSDADGTISTYSWAQVSGPSTATLTNAGTAIATAANLIAGVYNFELTVTDNSGASSKAQVKITVVAAGLQPPIANAGANLTITLPTNQVGMDGSGSVAPSGNIVSYTWTQTSGPSAATLGTPNSAQASAGNLVAGTYIFRLTIKDNNNATATDSLIVLVNPAVNIPPVANAGSGITITLPVNTATLDGSASSDADGTITAYSWTQVSGPNTAGATGASTATISLTGLIAGDYVYQLQVTDNSGAKAIAQVKVSVVATANVLPIANAGVDQTITAPASTVSLDGSASHDPDGTIKSYSWVLISGNGSVTISNGNTVNPSASGLIPGTYVFQLTVTDNSGATAKDQVTVTVNPEPTLPNQAPVANAGNNLTITEPVNTAGLNGSSSFDPDGTIASYSWSQVSGPSTAVILNNGTATPTVAGLVVGTYKFALTVTDNDGATSTDDVTVTVNAAVNKVNQMPIALAGKDTTVYLPVNSYTLSAAGSFDPDGTISSYQWQEISGPNTVIPVDAGGQQADASNLQVGVYEFQVTVTDNEGATSTAMVKVTVDKGEGYNDQLILFPNPAHDVTTARITSSANGTIRVNVYDMNGRIVLTDQSEKSLPEFEKTLNVSSLASGMYTIQIIIGNHKTMVTKFIKQ